MRAFPIVVVCLLCGLWTGAALPAGTAPSATCAPYQNTLVMLVRSAQMYIDVCAHTLALPSLTTELIAAKQRGVQVRVIIDRNNAAASWNEAIKLAPFRIPVRGTPWGEVIRESFLLVDRARGTKGPIDWKATDTVEAGIVPEASSILSDPAIVAPLIASFDRMWADCRFADLMAPPPAVVVAPEKPIVVSVDDLYMAYAENAVSAAQKYGEKIISVNGPVAEVNSLSEGKAEVVFKIMDWEGWLQGFVRCEFPAERVGTLTAVRKDEDVVITGTCRGKLLPYSVIVVDCRLTSKR